MESQSKIKTRSLGLLGDELCSGFLRLLSEADLDESEKQERLDIATQWLKTRGRLPRQNFCPVTANKKHDLSAWHPKHPKCSLCGFVDETKKQKRDRRRTAKYLKPMISQLKRAYDEAWFVSRMEEKALPYTNEILQTDGSAAYFPFTIKRPND